MSVQITGPIKLVIAVFLGLVMIIAIIVALSQTGIGGSSVSTQLVSTNSNYITLIPWIGLIVAAGMVFVALESKHK